MLNYESKVTRRRCKTKRRRTMTTKKSEINTTKHKVTIQKCKTTIITATRRKSDSKKTNRSKMITKIH